MRLIEAFLKDIDAQWSPGPEKFSLRIIGSAALFLQTDYERGTKDSDVWETEAMTGEIKAALTKIAGKGSVLHQKHRIYLDIVINGLPFLPQGPHFHKLDRINKSLNHIQIEALDIVDVVVSKIARFKADDVADISSMIKQRVVPHGEFVKRFQSALDVSSLGAKADKFTSYIKNFHAVERDFFGVAETEIDSPEWAG
jgi:hypothetical protein